MRCAGQNVQAAVGRIGAQPIGDAQFQLNIQTKGRLTEPEEFENVVVRANPDGSYVRVRDVGRVELAARSSNSFGRFNGGPGALIAIFQAPGANALSTAEGVQAVMQRLQAQFPEGVAYKTTYDSTAFVLQSIDEVIHTLIEAFILVVIVVFLFLGNLRATLIPLIAVPVSLIGTFAVMLALGFSLNMVSLWPWCWRSASWSTTPSSWSRRSRPIWRPTTASRRRTRPSGPWARSPRPSWRSPWCCCRCSCRWRSSRASRASSTSSSRWPWRCRW